MDYIAASEIDGIAISVPPRSVIDFAPLGTVITPDEVSARLSANLYKQLIEGSAITAQHAIDRAQIYVGAILHRLGVDFNLDNKAIREIVLINVVYELHIALGHEEAGREYRLKAKDMILAAYGNYPDTDDKSAVKVPVAAVVAPVRRTILGL